MKIEIQAPGAESLTVTMEFPEDEATDAVSTPVFGFVTEGEFDE